MTLYPCTGIGVSSLLGNGDMLNLNPAENGPSQPFLQALGGKGWFRKCGLSSLLGSERRATSQQAVGLCGSGSGGRPIKDAGVIDPVVGGGVRTCGGTRRSVGSVAQPMAQGQRCRGGG